MYEHIIPLVLNMMSTLFTTSYFLSSQNFPDVTVYNWSRQYEAYYDTLKTGLVRPF